jgi:hypothetical protein
LEEIEKMSASTPREVGGQVPLALCVELSPDDQEPTGHDPLLDDPADDEASAELELDDPTIDEAGLPQLDTDDPEALVQQSDYEDLLDRGWLERTADDDPENDSATLEDIGLTIDLDGPEADDEGAQFLDLDVGGLLTSLPGGDGLELELEPGLDRGDGVGVGTLRDLLLPDGDDDSDDREVGDDARFPVFDDGGHIVRRPLPDDDADIARDDDLV